MRQEKSHKLAKYYFTGMLIIAAIALSGCSFDSPTFYSQKKVEVSEEVRHIEAETTQLDKATLSAIATDYLEQGDGPLDIVVTYNPSARGNSAMMASDNAARISQTLGHMNVNNVNIEILPIHHASVSKTLISYTAYTAHAPQGCTDFAMIDDSAHENFRPYELGCSTETYLARQIARPQDLLGRDGDEGVEDGRKRANVVEAYKSRVQNETLNAERTY